MADAFPVLMSYVDNRHCYLYMNAAYEKWFGIRRERSIGRHVAEVIGETAYRNVRPHIEEALKGRPLTFEAGIPYKGMGAPLEVMATYVPDMDPQGSVSGMYAMVIDISDLRQAERRVAKSEQRFREFFERMPEAAAIYEAAGDSFVLKDMNPAAEQLEGLKKGQALGARVDRLFPGGAGTDLLELLRKVAATGQTGFMPVRFCRNGSQSGWRKGIAYRIGGGEVVFVQNDVSAQVYQARRLEEQKQFLEKLIDTIPNPVFFKDAEGIYLGCNSAFARLFGRCKQAVIGRTAEDLAPSESAALHQHMDRELFRHEGAQTYQARVEVHGGAPKEMLFNKVRFSDADDEAAGIVGVMVDLTDLEEARRALVDSERFNRMLVAQLPVGLALCRLDGRFVEVNPAFARILDRSPEAVRQLSCWDVVPPECLEQERERFAQLEQTGRYGPHERPYLRPDGSRVPVRQQGLLVEKNGERLIWSSVEDISERVESERQQGLLESQLRQAQKLEAIGTLAGGIAHDFNNILTSVIGYGELALLRSPERSELREYALGILQAGKRARDLAKQILTFSRMDAQELQPVQVKLIIREALKLLRPSLPSTIEIRQRIQSDACVMADPTQIHQILMNLCTNAEHAMRERGGMLEIVLEEVRIEADGARRYPGLGAGRHIRLAVSDSGCGMAPQVRERIFEPFFTTKEKGEGTGLGLSVVHGIVKSCGGHIDVDTAPGRGASFRILLPVAEGPAAESCPEPAGALPCGAGRILLVDDEPSLARAIAMLLEDQGYRVSVLTRSPEALELFRAKPDSFDLVITDLTMPKMDGKGLAEEIRALRPQVPIILCSGFLHGLSEEKVLKLGIQAFVQKPILRAQLLETVRRVMVPGRNHSPEPRGA
jgi:PAS domain S-box-containing protein